MVRLETALNRTELHMGSALLDLRRMSRAMQKDSKRRSDAAAAEYEPERPLTKEGLLQLLSTDYKFAVSFVILVVVLLARPTGIFRGKVI